MEMKITTLEGKESGSVELSDAIFGLEPRSDILQRCVNWQLAKRQRGTHKTKDRSEIWRTGKKMYAQKGTGGARHGSARVPQFRGGGRAFGPVVRSHAIDLPKKVRALALKHALSSKAKDGGIIVIDFIDMDERRNRNKVVQALEEALRKDRAPTKILSFNDFGLVAITRKRVKQSLERTLCEPCSYCSGAGWIKSVSTVCHEILAEAKKMAADLEGDVVTLRVNPEVARALKSREGLVLGELESLLRKNVIVKSDEAVHQERFEIYAT